MHPVRQQRLIALLVIILGASIAIGIALYALRQNIDLFYTPSQALAGNTPANQVFRLGGMVEKGSVHKSTDGLDINFVVTDMSHTMPVHYHGVLPDLFREGQGVVMDGQLNNEGVYEANRVLAKHDENYMPKAMMDAVQQANLNQQAVQEPA